MKKFIPSVAAMLLLGPLAFSAGAGAYYDYAKVTHVRPVYKKVTVRTPQTQCYPVNVRTHRHDPASSLVGAIIGGAIGNAIGENSASTLTGAIIGSSIGYEAGHGRRITTQRCERVNDTYHTTRKLTGYKVSYRYKGETYHSFMDDHPGKKIKVRVKVSPVG